MSDAPPRPTLDELADPPLPNPVRPDPRRPLVRWLYTVLYLPVFWSMVLLFGFQGFHRRRLFRRRGVIVLANHQAHLDPMVVGLSSTEPLNYMARSALFRIPVFRRLIRVLGAFPVQRGSRDRSALDHAIALLRAGHNVLIFGEGTRSWDWEILPIRGGVEVIARASRAPVVPVLLDGAGQSNPRGKGPLAVDAQRIAVAVGRPIPAEEYDRWPERSMPDTLRAILVRDLSDLRRFTRGPHRADGQIALSRVALRLILTYLVVLRWALRLGRRRRRRG